MNTSISERRKIKMKPQILHPYHYSYVSKQVENLLNVYTSVNDLQTIQTFQGLAYEKIHAVLADDVYFSTLITQLIDRRLTKKKSTMILEELKQFVIPFQPPSDKQLIKVFKKVKKLKLPKWGEHDLRDYNYFGWNDLGTGRKFMILYQENQIIGVYGTISPTIKKGLCAICNEISNVSLFLATTKSSGDGTYTKKGNYICYDSARCNHQMSDLEGLNHFIDNILLDPTNN